ncbi:hypothetical protein L209DRAFT_514841 [Thermothelomyces heterothallicus CBS 203.75]
MLKGAKPSRSPSRDARAQLCFRIFPNLPFSNNGNAFCSMRRARNVRRSASTIIVFGLLGMQKPCSKQPGPGTGCPTRPIMLLLYARRWSGACQLPTGHVSTLSFRSSDGHLSAEKSIIDVLNPSQHRELTSGPILPCYRTRTAQPIIIGQSISRLTGLN